MIIPLCHTGRSWLVPSLLILAVLIAALQWWYLYLPPFLQDAVTYLGHGRLYADLGQGFFRIHQVWTQIVYHDNWWHLLAALLPALALGSAWEAQLGTQRIALLLFILAPLAASAQILFASIEPSYGIGLLIAAAFGGLLAQENKKTIQWSCWYMLPWALGCYRFLSGPLLIGTGWMCYELIRQVLSYGILSALFSLLVLVLVALISYTLWKHRVL